MLESEAKWLHPRLARYLSPDTAPVLNLGSSTLEFRTKTQPYITEQVITPIEEITHSTVMHSDAKMGSGIDMPGDMYDPTFQAEIKARQFKTVICTNLLQQVVDAKKAIEIIASLPAQGGLVFVTAPHVFPYFADPVENMFRPTPKELASYFAKHGFSVLEQELVVDEGSYAGYLMQYPWQAVKQISQFRNFFKKFQISAIIARKI